MLAHSKRALLLSCATLCLWCWFVACSVSKMALRTLPRQTNTMQSMLERPSMQRARELLTKPLPTDKNEAGTEVALLLEYSQTATQIVTAPDARASHNRPTSWCTVICRSSRSICKAATRICDISKRFPKEPTFQTICQRAQGDCQRANQSCVQCKP